MKWEVIIQKVILDSMGAYVTGDYSIGDCSIGSFKVIVSIAQVVYTINTLLYIHR